MTTKARARRRSRCHGSAWLLIALLCLPAAARAAPVLMVLEHLADGARVRTEVRVVLEHTASPHAGKGQLKWAILPGEAIESPTRPADRIVHLFRRVGLQHAHICSVHARYFRNKVGAWAPHFRLDEQPLIVRRNGRWQPLEQIAGVASLLVLTSSTLPNAEGFYPALEFGMTTGLTFIDSWIVR